MFFPIFLTGHQVYSDFKERFFGMGMLRIMNRDLAIARLGRFGYRGLEALHEHSYRTVLIPDKAMHLRGRGRFETLRIPERQLP